MRTANSRFDTEEKVKDVDEDSGKPRKVGAFRVYNLADTLYTYDMDVSPRSDTNDMVSRFVYC